MYIKYNILGVDAIEISIYKAKKKKIIFLKSLPFLFSVIRKMRNERLHAYFVIFSISVW